MVIFYKANDSHLVPLTEDDASGLREDGWIVSETINPKDKERWLLTLGERSAALDEAKNKLHSLLVPGGGLSPLKYATHLAKLRPAADRLSLLSELDLGNLPPVVVPEEEISAIVTAAKVGQRLTTNIRVVEGILNNSIKELDSDLSLAWDGEDLYFRGDGPGRQKKYQTAVIEAILVMLGAEHGITIERNSVVVQRIIQAKYQRLFGIELDLTVIEKVIGRVLGGREQEAADSVPDAD